MTWLLLFTLAQKLAVIEGTVIGSDGAGPLAKAKVGIQYEKPPDASNALTSTNAKGNATVTTDDGRFRLEAIEGIPFHLSLEREGYISVGQNFGTGPAELRHTLTAHKSGVQIKMDPESILGGTILDADTNKAIPGIVITTFRENERRGWSFGPEATSDAAGRFQIKAMPAGEYKLLLQSQLRPKLVPGWHKDELQPPSYPALYFPGVEDFASASSAIVGKGARLDYFDIKLRKQPRFRIRGRLAPDVASVMATSMVRYGYDVTSFDKLGNLSGSSAFEIQNIPPGRFGITFYTQTSNSLERLQAVLDLVVSGNLEDLDVTLTPALKARVTVRSFGDKQIDGDPLWTQFNPAINIQFAPLSRINFSSDRPQIVNTAEGSELDGLFPDPMLLYVSGLPKGWVVRRVIYNGLEIDRYNLKLDPSRPEHRFEIQLSPASNSITGEVRQDNKPLPGARVIAIPEPLESEPVLRRMLSSTTDAEGRYSFQILTPGTYHVLSTNSGYMETIAAIRSGKGQKVELGINTTSHLPLKIPD